MSAELLNPPAPTFHHLGPPSWWTCPHCALSILVYPALPVDHRCPNYNATAGPRTFYYYYVLADDARIRSLHLVGVIADDPLLRVTTLEEGKLVAWERRIVGDEVRFYPPDPERPTVPDMWYDGRIQTHEAIPRAELERRAMRGRHSA